MTLGDFSGPLDLLCHLVESRAMDAAKLKLSDVLSQYVAYMVSAKKATLAELAEFFSLASRLLLRKVRSLLPTSEPFQEPAGVEEDALTEEEFDEAALAELLERFKPYREAARRMALMKEERERSFLRMTDETGSPWYDLGDLYGLSTLWWRLIAESTKRRASGTEEGFMLEIPDAVPEEVLVERRMGEVRDILREAGRMTLRRLLGLFPNNSLIVTLLALLELSRLGSVALCQSEAWGDVDIAAA